MPGWEFKCKSTYISSVKPYLKFKDNLSSCTALGCTQNQIFCIWGLAHFTTRMHRNYFFHASMRVFCRQSLCVKHNERIAANKINRSAKLLYFYFERFYSARSKIHKPILFSIIRVYAGKSDSIHCICCKRRGLEAKHQFLVNLIIKTVSRSIIDITY